MSLLELVLISVALGLDAFGVAISVGLDRRVNKFIAFWFILSFGFFQFFFAFIGGFAGSLFKKYFFALPGVVGGIIILLVGILMLKEAMSQEEPIKRISWILIILLGVCVSIDALVVAFSAFSTFGHGAIILKKSVIVGSVACGLTTIAFLICKKIRRVSFIKEYADILGGTILVLLGFKMIFF